MKSSHLYIKSLNEMITLASKGQPAPKPVGYGFDAYNRPVVGFLKTDQDTNRPKLDVHGNPGINWRAQRPRS